MRRPILPAPRTWHGIHLAVVAAALLAVALLAGELGGVAFRALAVCGLLVGGLLLVRRGRPATHAARAVEILERHPLGKDTGLALVRAGGRTILVGFGPAGAALVTELAPATEAGATP